MKEVSFSYGKFLKMTVLNITKSASWESGSIVEMLIRYHIIKEISILYRIAKIRKVPMPSI